MFWPEAANSSNILFEKVELFLSAYITSTPSPPPAFIWLLITITSLDVPNAFLILFVLSIIGIAGSGLYGYKRKQKN